MSAVCADCGKPGFPDATGAMAHDRRSIQGNAPDGTERRASAPPTPVPAPALPKIEKPPLRLHWLHKKWLGFGPQQ